MDHRFVSDHFAVRSARFDVCGSKAAVTATVVPIDKDHPDGRRGNAGEVVDRVADDDLNPIGETGLGEVVPGEGGRVRIDLQGDQAAIAGQAAGEVDR